MTAFAIAECSLRLLGYKPGIYIYTKYFTPVETLKLKPGPEGDEAGVFKFLPKSIAVFRNNSSPQTLPDLSQISSELYLLMRESYELKKSQTQSDFAEYYKKLRSKPVSALTDLEKGVMDYVDSPLNDDGFRSIRLRQYVTNKKKILLLGDSFTWGHSAFPISFSFADELLAKGHVVYNTGVSGADSAQYLALAKKYIPILKPDVVIVNFFLGNDVSYYKRDLKPHVPIYFHTNAGSLITFQDGLYFESPESIYRFILRNYSIPAEKNLTNRILSQTSVTTLVWKMLLNMKWVDSKTTEDAEFWHQSQKLRFPKPYSNVEVEQIKYLAEKENARFLLVAIADRSTAEFTPVASIPGLFDHIKYYDSSVGPLGFAANSGHFNNLGHKLHAEFLNELIVK